MRHPRSTPLGRYNLLLDLSVLVLASAILFLAVWFTLAEINRKYLELRLADAAKVHLFLESRLTEARESLIAFADLPEAEHSPTVLKLFPAFSNLYLLISGCAWNISTRLRRTTRCLPDFPFPGASWPSI